MTVARVRQASGWTTLVLVATIVLLTLVLSPAEGDPLSRLVPGVPFFGSSDGYDTCLGGIQCGSGHALAFVALGLSLTIRAVAGHRGPAVFFRAAFVLAAIVLFATASELAQGWTGRDASLDDWMADVGGALLGMALGAGIAGLLVQE